MPLAPRQKAGSVQSSWEHTVFLPWAMTVCVDAAANYRQVVGADFTCVGMSRTVHVLCAILVQHPPFMDVVVSHTVMDV